MMMTESWWFRSSVVVGLCEGLLRSMLGCGWFIYGVGANRSQLGRLDGIQKKALMKCLHVVVSVPKEVVQVETQLERLCLCRLIATKRILPNYLFNLPRYEGKARWRVVYTFSFKRNRR
jgi:hypothetical protein